ncbi:DUF3429 domain-containing protein [Methylobacterium iners]|jgi:hypothetical protein|uniref:DUF3429 domain-containing protein n=1 Tax=Methylobacterium iners TaxID=418707 RepID=A0ABQ4RVW4_9HYPH|nr:DUF3429 domain-containing protein [Methylobacterium iners]GJD94970.1 hypothetical protein OCOJLMKI_2178 [Methylobacterium iners]
MARATPVPPLALVLGIAGLIPFLGFAFLSISGNDGGLSTIGLSPRTILSAYGAVIASFLGGIRWGAAAAREGSNLDYLVAILPSLIAWTALALPAPWDLRVLGILVLAWGLIDQDLPRRGLVPRWLGWLRLALSGVAGAALLVAA